MENIIISVTNKGEKLTLEVSRDSNLWEWGRIFKIILQWLTFSKDSADELIP